MKFFDALGIVLLVIAALVPEGRIETWIGLCSGSLLCFLLAFGLSVWEGSAEDVL